MPRNRVLLCLLLVLSAGWASEDIIVADGYPAVPNPIGFEKRVALLDWFHDHRIQVASDATEAALVARYKQHWDDARALEAAKAAAQPQTAQAAADPDAPALRDLLLQLRIQYHVTMAEGSSLAEARARLDQERLKEKGTPAATAATDGAAAASDTSVPSGQHPAAAKAGGPAPAKPVRNSRNPGADGRWISDAEQARKSATDDRRMILMLFTGSDWCPWCIKLENEILATGAFRSWASDNLVLLYLDFPRQKHVDPEVARANTALASQYGVKGYPTVVFTDAAGKALWRYGYEALPAAAWIAKCNRALGIAP